MVTKLYKMREKKHESFGSRLKKERKARYATQQEFADAIGASVESVRNWEQGWILPEVGTLFRICDLLDCDLDYLIGRLEQKTHDETFIHNYTGLSEDAIKTLHKYNNAKDRTSSWPSYLSNIICHHDFRALMNDISDYMIVVDSKYQNVIDDLDHGVLDMTAAGLFYISRTMSNIVEDLESREHSHERSHEHSGF